MYIVYYCLKRIHNWFGNSQKRLAAGFEFIVRTAGVVSIPIPNPVFNRLAIIRSSGRPNFEFF